MSEVCDKCGAEVPMPSDRSGGEPLSPEMSPEVEAAIDEFSGRIFRWYDDQASPALPGPGEILSAFAREIQQDGENWRDQYRHAEAELKDCEQALLASQESCRLLAEAQAKASSVIQACIQSHAMRCLVDVCHDHRMFRDLKLAIGILDGAVGSSEAGKEKA